MECDCRQDSRTGSIPAVVTKLRNTLLIVLDVNSDNGGMTSSG